MLSSFACSARILGLVGVVISTASQDYAAAWNGLIIYLVGQSVGNACENFRVTKLEAQ